MGVILLEDSFHLHGCELVHLLGFVIFLDGLSCKKTNGGLA